MKRPADLFGVVVLAVIGAAALVVSARYLALLAQILGWETWTSWLLPVAVDLLAAYAVRCWLSGDAEVDVRRFARKVAIAALAVSILGNAAAHILIAWPGLLGDVARIALTVGVGAVPPIALFVAVHLYAIGASPLPTRRASPRVDVGSGVVHSPEPQSLPEVEASESATPVTPQLHAVRVADEFPTVMLEQARELDSTHMNEHGRPMSQDKLRTTFGIGKERAAKLQRAIREAA